MTQQRFNELKNKGALTLGEQLELKNEIERLSYACDRLNDKWFRAINGALLQDPTTDHIPEIHIREVAMLIRDMDRELKLLRREK
jgi:hypothetical protein